MLRLHAFLFRVIIASSRRVGGYPPAGVSVRFVLRCFSFEDIWRFQRQLSFNHTHPPLLHTRPRLALAVNGVVLRQLNSLEQRKADTAWTEEEVQISHNGIDVGYCQSQRWDGPPYLRPTIPQSCRIMQATCSRKRVSTLCLHNRVEYPDSTRRMGR